MNPTSNPLAAQDARNEWKAFVKEDIENRNLDGLIDLEYAAREMEWNIHPETTTLYGDVCRVIEEVGS